MLSPHAPQVEPLLTIIDLEVAFGGLYALRSVSLTIQPGEVVAVVGANGAGKSTLLNAICGLIPAKGRVRLGDSDLLDLPASRVAAAGIGRSFQDPQLIEHDTVLENILVGAHGCLGYNALYQLLRRSVMRRREFEYAERAQSLAETMHLGDDLERPVSELTYGAKKMVDVCRALVSSPRLLILDEPSSGLDSADQAVVISALKAACRNGEMSVLIVEHHMDVVRNLADRVIELRAGAIATGDGVELEDPTADADPEDVVPVSTRSEWKG